MKSRKLIQAAILVATAVVPRMAVAESAPGTAVGPAFDESIPNISDKSIIAVVVSYPPGGKTPPHRHAPSAFVTSYVLSGAIRSRVDGGKVQVFNAGESWSEKPGAHHKISENASSTEPAKVLAIFVVDTQETNLTILEGQ